MTMSLEPLERPQTLTSVVVDRIAEAILRGEFEPGVALPEVRLAESLDTSRSTVREALRALEDLGLIEIRPHKGAVVKPLTVLQARETFSLRAVLEGYSVRTAIEQERIDEPAIESITAAFDDLRSIAQSSGHLFDLIEADMRLHWAICEPSRHGLLLDSLRRLQVKTRHFIVYTKLLHAELADEVASHEELLAAVFSLDPDHAEAGMRDHIITAGEHLVQRMHSLGLD
jgi:DNA-binding GntR family transcriptional regulator